MTEPDPWTVLGLAPDSPWPQVRRAYLDLVQVWHPDRFAGDVRLQAKAAQTMARINIAYGVLERRRNEAPSPPPPAAAAAPPPQGRPADAGSPTATARTEPSRSGDASNADAPRDRPASSEAGARSRERDRNVAVGPEMLRGRRRREPGSAYAPGFASRGIRDTYDHQSAGTSARVAVVSGVIALLVLAAVIYVWDRPAEPPAEQASTVATPDATPPADDPRPASGTDLLPSELPGSGALDVDNAAEKSDAVVLLMRDNASVRAVYVRAGESATLGSIAPGTYSIRLMRGTSWTDDRFLIDLEYAEFLQPVTFAGAARHQLSLKRMTGAGPDVTRSVPVFRLTRPAGK